jgi:hypothetical protein
MLRAFGSLRHPLGSPGLPRGSDQTGVVGLAKPGAHAFARQVFGVLVHLWLVSRRGALWARDSAAL